MSTAHKAKIAVIEYERDGALFRTKLVSTDPLFGVDLSSPHVQGALRAFYASIGRTLARIVTVEDVENEIQCSAR